MAICISISPILNLIQLWMLKWNIQDRPIWKSEIVVIFLNQVIGFITNHLVLVLSLQLYQLYQRKPWSRRCKYQRLWFMVLEEKHSSQHAHEQGAETSWNQQQRSSSNNVQYNCSKCCSCQLLSKSQSLGIWAFSPEKCPYVRRAPI